MGTRSRSGLLHRESLSERPTKYRPSHYHYSIAEDVFLNVDSQLFFLCSGRGIATARLMGCRSNDGAKFLCLILQVRELRLQVFALERERLLRVSGSDELVGQFKR